MIAWKWAPPEAEGAQSGPGRPGRFPRQGVGKTSRVTVTIVLDCVDRTAVLVGHQDLTAEGPEAWRRYSWSFNLWAPAAPVSAICVGVPAPSTCQTPPGLARHDHVVAKCAHIVERNPGMVRVAAYVWDRRKYISRGEGIGWIGWREPIDKNAICDKNVARGEPGIRRLDWSYSHVHFFARVADKARDRRQHRESPVAGDRLDVSVVGVKEADAEVAREQFSPRSGHAYGPVGRGKETCTAVNDSCER